MRDKMTSTGMKSRWLDDSSGLRFILGIGSVLDMSYASYWWIPSWISDRKKKPKKLGLVCGLEPWMAHFG